MPRNKTVEEKGACSVIKMLGAEKQRPTVMLAVTAERLKLPPSVIFKRKTLPKETFPCGIHICVPKEGWMTADLTVDWTSTVRQQLGTLLPSLLAVDSCCGYPEESVRAKLEEVCTDIAVILDGLSQ